MTPYVPAFLVFLALLLFEGPGRQFIMGTAMLILAVRCGKVIVDGAAKRDRLDIASLLLVIFLAGSVIGSIVGSGE